MLKSYEIQFCVFAGNSQNLKNSVDGQWENGLYLSAIKHRLEFLLLFILFISLKHQL